MEVTQIDISFIQQIFDHQPEATVFVRPVWEGQDHSRHSRITDFEFVYCNAPIRNLNGLTREELIGKRILRDGLPDPGIRDIIFSQCLQVYETGMPMEYTYFSTELEKYVSLQRIKLQDGVLTTARNRTEEYKTQAEKEKQARLLQSLIDNSPYGVSLYESIRNQQGTIEDFKLRLCNERSADITAISREDLYAKTVKELMTMRGPSAYFEICKEVVQTGEPVYTEYYSSARDQWLALSIVKFEDGYLQNYIDITKTKKLEEEAWRNAHELNIIFNGSLSSLYSARVVRNGKGNVCDLIFLRANASFYKTFGATEEQIIGRSLLSISGHDDQSAFIQYADEVIETGIAAIHELNYQEPERWFEFSMVKLDEDTISVTVNDITKQKMTSSEIEKQRNLLNTILKQSPNGLSITKAIRDEEGNMVDAIAVLMNDACEKLNGMPNEVMLHNSVGTLDPGILNSPLFQSAKALPVGESFRTEYVLPLSGRWLELAVAKMDEDHYINVFTDITAIKEGQLQLERKPGGVYKCCFARP
jgi:PAS domain-containing protein